MSSQHADNVDALSDSVPTQFTPTPSVAAMALASGSAPGEDSTNSSDSQQIQPEKELADSWASLVGKHSNSFFEGTAAEHVSQVRPIFLAYKCVSWEGSQIPITEVATAITKIVDAADQIDGIQVIKAGWNIYMKIESDRAQLLLSGVNIAGRHVALTAARKENSDSVKIILKDLPLHEVLNQDTLTLVKEHVDVLSDVKYSNIFVDGRRMHLCNGDRFLYISPEQVDKLPSIMHCKGFPARVVKPIRYQTCFCYGQVRHRAASDDCPALALVKVKQTIQPFQGGQNQLSNLCLSRRVCLAKCGSVF